MNWLRRHVRPRLRLLNRSDRSEGDTLWHTCQGCGQLIFHKDFEENQSVCPQCGHHHRIGPKERFEALFDFAAWDLVELPKGKDDPLKFRDKKRYSDRLKEARNKTGDQEALISGRPRNATVKRPSLRSQVSRGRRGCALSRMSSATTALGASAPCSDCPTR